MNQKQPSVDAVIATVGAAIVLMLAQNPSSSKSDAHKSTKSSPAASSPSRALSCREPTPEERMRRQEIEAQGGALHKRAQALLRAGKVQEAEQVCREEIAFYNQFGGNSVALVLMGDILLAQGEYKKALEQYMAFSLNGQSVTVSLKSALCYVRLGDLDKARRVLRKCPDANLALLSSESPAPRVPYIPDLKSMEPELLVALAEITSDGYEARLKYCLAADKLMADHSLLAERIGLTLDRLKRYDEAIPYYRIVIEHEGDKASYRVRMRVEAYDLAEKQKQK